MFRAKATFLSWLLVACLSMYVARECRSQSTSRINVLTHTQSRTGIQNFVMYPGYGTLRGDLLDPAKFGPSGTVPRSVNLLPSVNEMTPETLAGADVALCTATPTTSELSALRAFVENGGGLFVFENNIAHFASVFGASGGGINGNGVQALVVDGNSPLVNGVFGSISQGTRFYVPYHGYLSDVGPYGHVAITENNRAFGVSFAIGRGRIAAFGDEEIFMNSAPGTNSDPRLTSTTRTIFLNSFNYVVPPVVTPPPNGMCFSEFGDPTQVDEGPGSDDDPAATRYYQAPTALLDWRNGDNVPGRTRTDILTLGDNRLTNTARHFVLRDDCPFIAASATEAILRFDVYYDEDRPALATDRIVFWDERDGTEINAFAHGARLHALLNPNYNGRPRWVAVLLNLNTGQATASEVDAQGNLTTNYGELGAAWGGHAQDLGSYSRVIELAADGTLFGVVNDDLPLSYVSFSVRAATTVTVSGQVDLQGCTNPAQTVFFHLSPLNGDRSLHRVVQLGADGSFTLAGIPPQPYEVWVKGTKWLAKLMHIDASFGNVTDALFDLPAGDANSDNFVDVLDLDILLQAFDSVPGDMRWQEGADFNCDYSVDVLDLDLLIQNFDRAGDE